MTASRRVRVESIEVVLQDSSLDSQELARALSRHGNFRAVAATPSEASTEWAPRSWKAGIYVIDTGDGFAYVGQTINLASRLNQHRKTWPTLRAICFASAPRAALDDMERDIARDLHACGIRLWNKTLIDVLCVASPLDERFPMSEHERWQTDLAWNEWGGERQQDPDLRHRYQGANDAFRREPASAALIDVFRRFVETTIPAPLKTEIAYWSITCRNPSRSGPFLRLNVGHQATLDGFRDRSGTGWTLRLWIPEVLAEDALGAVLRTDAKGNGVAKLSAVNVSASFEYSNLVAAGPDQIILDVDGVDRFGRLLDSAEFVARMRRMHLGLMQRGKNMNKRSHCLALSDDLITRAAPSSLGSTDRPRVNVGSVDRRSGSRGSTVERAPVVVPAKRAYTITEQQVLKLLPAGAARIAAVTRLYRSIELATAVAPMQWGLSVLRGFLRLSVGMIEVTTVEPDGVRLLVLHPLIPPQCDADPGLVVRRSTPNPNAGVYPSVSQSAIVDVPSGHADIARILDSELNDAHVALVKRAGDTRANPMTRKAHKAEAVDLIRELFLGLK